MNVFDFSNYRTFLRETLAERCQKNPRYSLRAMSSQLMVSPATLSLVMKGKKNLSAELASQLAERLSLAEVEADYFNILVQIETTKNQKLREALTKRLSALSPRSTKNSDLSLEHFKVISDWYHFAIMTMTELSDFAVNPKSIARSLAISLAEAERAVERLLNLEMLEYDKHGLLKKVEDNPRVISQAPNGALRNYHRQTIAKAADSLETQTPQEKIIGSETVAIDVQDLPKYKELSEEFFNKVLNLAKKSKEKNHVYHLGVQFFRFTKKE